MNHLMKLSRLGKPRATPLCSLMSRNASHFTYVPDAPMENMGKQDYLNNGLGIYFDRKQHFICMASNLFREFILNYVEKNIVMKIQDF